jgi:hypothetical protein
VFILDLKARERERERERERREEKREAAIHGGYSKYTCKIHTKSISKNP